MTVTTKISTLATALVLGLAALSGPAAAKFGAKPPVSNVPAPVYPGKKLHLACHYQVASIPALGIVERKVKITNTSGVTLPAGKRVYWSKVRRVFGKPTFRYLVLKYPLQPGYSITRKVRATYNRCSAYAYLKLFRQVR